MDSDFALAMMLQAEENKARENDDAAFAWSQNNGEFLQCKVRILRASASGCDADSDIAPNSSLDFLIHRGATPKIRVATHF